MATRGKTSQKSSVDVGVVKAIGHPLRMQLLARLNERVASPVELARELDESVQLVSYHVRILRDLGFVELVSTTPRRGAIEHHYRAVRRQYFSDQDYASLPANARAAITGTALESLFTHAASAHEAGVFDDDPENHVSTSDFILDKEAYDELSGMMKDLLERAMDLQAQSAKRIQGGEDEVRARLSMMLYVSPANAAPATRSGRKQSPKRSRKK